MSQDSTKSIVTLNSHIESTPGTCGGKPRIVGHRIRVQDVVVWYERMGLSADDIVGRHPQLSLADVHAALAYYHDHREEVDGQMMADAKLVEEIRAIYPSKLKAKLDPRA